MENIYLEQKCIGIYDKVCDMLQEHYSEVSGLIEDQSKRESHMLGLYRSLAWLLSKQQRDYGEFFKIPWEQTQIDRTLRRP